MREYQNERPLLQTRPGTFKIKFMRNTILPPPSLQARLESCTRIPTTPVPSIPSEEEVLEQCKGVGEYDQLRQRNIRKRVELDMKNHGYTWDGERWVLTPEQLAYYVEQSK